MEVAEEVATTQPLEDVTTRDVQALADAAAALVSRLVPGDVPLSWTPGICAAFDRLERLGAAGKTLLADRLAESKAWERAGFASAAEYMANRSGTTVTGARDTLAASRRLGDLPATGARLREGVLSTSQVQQITDAASRNPAAESGLLDKATDGSSLHELREACGRAKAAADKDDDERNKRLRAQRRLRQHRDTDGAWSLWAKGTVPDAAKFNAAIEEIIDGLLQDAHDRGEALTREQAAYDALIEMADRVTTTDWTDLDHDLDNESEADDEHDEAGDDGEPDDDDTYGVQTGDSHGDTTTQRTDHDPGDSVGEPDGGVDDGGGSDGVGDLARTGRGGAGVSGRRVGNGTGCAGAVHRQDNTSSRPGNDERSSRGERTDDMSARPGSDRTPDHGNADGALNRRRRRPRRKAQPYLGIVRADLAALRRGHPVDGEVVEIAGLGSISVPDARELLGGDAVLQLVLSSGVHANVTNLRRSPNTAQRMALLAQMPCCSVKGCNRTWTQIDHRHDWAHTHATRLEDLDPLCYQHHRLKTLEGWALVPGTGKRDFVGPTDPRHPNNLSDRTPAPDAPTDGVGQGLTDVAAARTAGSGIRLAPAEQAAARGRTN